MNRERRVRDTGTDRRRLVAWASATIVQVTLVAAGVLYTEYGIGGVDFYSEAFDYLLILSFFILILMMLGVPVSFALAVYYAVRVLSGRSRNR